MTIDIIECISIEVSLSNCSPSHPSIHLFRRKEKKTFSKSEGKICLWLLFCFRESDFMWWYLFLAATYIDSIINCNYYCCMYYYSVSRMRTGNKFRVRFSPSFRERSRETVACSLHAAAVRRVRCVCSIVLSSSILPQERRYSGSIGTFDLAGIRKQQLRIGGSRKEHS